jgi:hypothetical protein
MRTFGFSLAVIAALALGFSNFATAQAAGQRQAAGTQGANAKHFCPPGQAKKPGKGSAFNC